MPGVGGKANLVVDNDVDRAVSRVIRQIGQVHGLENDTLPAESSVAVQKNGHDLEVETLS